MEIPKASRLFSGTIPSGAARGMALLAREAVCNDFAKCPATAYFGTRLSASLSLAKVENLEPVMMENCECSY